MTLFQAIMLVIIIVILTYAAYKINNMVKEDSFLLK